MLQNSNPTVPLPAGTTAVKVLADNACYWSVFGYQVKMTLKSTDHVRQLLARAEPGSVTVNEMYLDSYEIENANSLLLYDAAGNMLPSKNTLTSNDWMLAA